MIIVTGASGKLGSLIVEKLLARVSADQIGVSVRDPQKAAALAARGVRVRHGDFADAASLKQAFEGATQVLMVSSNARAFGGDSLAQHRTAIAAAKAAGARRVLYTSHMGASPTSAFGPMHDHAATEELLRASGLPFTSLRNGFYATTPLGMIAEAMKTGELAAPADAKVSWIGHSDLAEAASAILASEGKFDGPTPPLTNSEAIDFEELTAIASKVSGRQIRRVIRTDDEHRAELVKRGLPAPVVAISMGMFAAIRAGEFSAVDPTLEQLVGHQPHSLREMLTTQLR